MFVWTNLAGQACTPTPLLRHISGEFADRVAAIWPAPHAEFLTASAAQRQLVWLGLSLGVEPLVLRRATAMPLKRAVRAVAPDGPDGLIRALGRLGETAWTAAEYEMLLFQLGQPESAKVLRHAEQIDPALVGAVSAFPPALLRSGLTRLQLSPKQSAVAGEAWSIIRTRDGAEAATRAAERWGRIADTKALFEAVMEDLMRPLPAAPFPDTTRLKALRSKAAMRDAAGRFNNCLRGRIRSAVEGWSAFYEWQGEPSAIVELNLDSIFGWRLDEVRLKDNAVMPAEHRDDLIACLRDELGVHVGRAGWELTRACEDALSDEADLQPVQHSIEAAFGD